MNISFFFFSLYNPYFELYKLLTYRSITWKKIWYENSPNGPSILFFSKSQSFFIARARGGVRVRVCVCVRKRKEKKKKNKRKKAMKLYQQSDKTRKIKKLILGRTSQTN